MVGLSTSKAVDDGFYVYSSPGSQYQTQTQTNYAIVPMQSYNNHEPNMTFLAAYCLPGAAGTFSTLQSYISTNQTTFTTTNATGLSTTNFVNSTNGFAPGQWAVIQHLGIPTRRAQYEAVLISAVQATNQLVFNPAPTNPVQPGDVINQETAWASVSIPSSSTTEYTVTGTGIICGQRAEPFLLVLSSAAGTNRIDAASFNWP